MKYDNNSPQKSPFHCLYFMDGGSVRLYRRSGSGDVRVVNRRSVRAVKMFVPQKRYITYSLVSKLTFIIFSPFTINTNEVGGGLVGLYKGWEGVRSSYKNAVVGGRT